MNRAARIRAERSRRKRRLAGGFALVTLIVVVIVLIHVGVAVLVGVATFRKADSFGTQSAQYRGRPTTEVPDPFATGPETDPSESVAPSPTGPRAATYPVRNDDDLARVCDGWYYPQSPKFAGKAPHQISVGVVDSLRTAMSCELSAESRAS